MRYTLLGNTGLAVSRLAFGAMTFTSGDDRIPAVYKTQAAEADELVGHALDAGINFFDTADVYAAGQSEEMLGQALGARRKDVVIATKCGIRSGEPLAQAGLNRRHILRSVDESLKRLGTDWIDVYIAHVEDPYAPLEETLEAFDQVVRSGKARYIGFSNWPAWRIAAALELQKANGWAKFSHGQMHYSLLCRDVEREIMPAMQRYGLGLTVWSPLSFGLLSGKYDRAALEDPANRLATFRLLPVDTDKGMALVDLMRPLADARGLSVAQLAIAWLLSRPQVTSVLLGASKQHQLADNLGAADFVLDDEAIAALDAATGYAPHYPAWFRPNLADQPYAAALDPDVPTWR
ncbi:aldo/keto reductase [Sphingomonas sp. 1P06PA]|uniref:aldo/keto reductase n=1 Tax=Sphingomonas sp. 1P06PA TaxID=554121 RepID=UPI0039A6C3B6